MKSYILHLETSTEVCSACISAGTDLLAIKESKEGYVHASMLSVYIKDCLDQADLSMKELSAVSVSAGPGSYTGLRVAFATAKGICHALTIPLISVSTLKALAFSFSQKHEDFNLYVPMLDARRNEVYTIVCDSKLKVLQPLQALILDPGVFRELNGSIAYFGNGAFKMKDQLKEGDGIYDWNCSAQHLIYLAHQQFLANDFDEMAYAVPQYLKPPNITIPKPLL